MDEQFEREECLPHSVEEVWTVLTDPDSLGQWLGEPLVADPAPGGELEVGDPAEEGHRTGFFEELDSENHRISFWWSRRGEEATRVEISLEETEEEATRILIVESRPLTVLDATGELIADWATERGGPQMSSVAALA